MTPENLLRWRLRLYEIAFDGGHHADVKLHAADSFSRLRTGGKEKADLDDDLRVCKARNTNLMDEEICQMHFCEIWDIENEPMTGKSVNDLIQKQ